MARTIMMAVILLVAFFWTPELKAAPGNPAPKSVPQSFIHPDKGYTLFAPPGARFIKKGAKIDISIQSPKGYAISVQSGPTKPQTNLSNMIAKLESVYLGKNKPWSNKLKENALTVAGMPARSAVYSGGNSRARTVIVRGSTLDFVFVFFAPPTEFDALQTEFNWILNNFRPASGKTGQPMSFRTFSDTGFGFTINYPNDWEVNKPSNHVVMFSGSAGTDAYYAVVSISNVNQGAGALKATADLKAQIASAATNVQYLKESAFPLNINGMNVQGQEFLASYVHKGQNFKKWVFVVPRPKIGIVHIWSYAAPDNFFERFKPIAEDIRRSWHISD